MKNLFLCLALLGAGLIGNCAGAAALPSLIYDGKERKMYPDHWMVANGESIPVQLAAGGADINTRDRHERTPLIMACMMRGENFLKIVKWLIDNRADVNLSDEWGDTPLHHAVWAAACSNKLDVIDMLLSAGARLNKKNKYGRTPFFEVAASGNTAAAEELIARGDTPEVADVFGRTPIFYAAVNGHLDMVKLLFEKYPQLDVMDNSGRNALSIAAGEGYIDVAEWLISRHSDYISKDNLGKSAIFYAVENNHWDVVNCLLDKNIDPNSCDNKGRSLLHYAAMKGNFESVRCLASRGAEINKRDEYGNTPLFYALKNIGMHIGVQKTADWLKENNAEE